MRLKSDFFQQDVLIVAPALLGKFITINRNGVHLEYMITEVEAYKGPEDLACHASKGRTARTEIMFGNGGKIYVYLIYGMYWMLNFVTGIENEPQAVLIRGIDCAAGPGKLGKLLGIDKSYYGEDLSKSDRIWVTDKSVAIDYSTSRRINIDYAGEFWAGIEWRFKIKS